MSLTAAQLLSWISAALVLQIAVGAAFAFRSYRRSSSRTHHQAAALDAPPRAPSATGGEPKAAWPGWREFRVERREVEDADASQCSFHLVPLDAQPLPPFRPGQYLSFALDIAGAGAPVTRCYSLSDRPEPTHYRITVKRVPGVPAHDGQPARPPGLSSNHFHDHVGVGSVLRVRAPAGRFQLDGLAPEVPAVLVAGGVGITPMMSMLRWSLAQQPERHLHLYYGLRHGGEHAFRATLQALAAAHPNLHLHVAYSRPAADDVPGRDYQHRGHVDIDLLRRTLPHGRHRFYVCGPPAMMESLVPALADWGVARADLHFEAFGPASVRLPDEEGAEATDAAAAQPATPAGPLEVRFERSGRTLTWQASDGHLLDFAERHGIVVASGCRSGGCGSCETRVLSGDLRYEHPPDHDVAEGCGLLCVGRPASNLVLEA